ncbi:putative lipoprotein [Leptospira sp. GIMC2001]|uniref:putative lipoprotein n=1 Tax=Leptospira sp. GIMC2001 TaxID=1513297 RepID=UPI0023498257|nr:putative lipoprotein [Leptospira sp. GIMC2001]WCL48236.1 putative lipoprotein [Leptospira sp. GIMC2001]
MNKNFPAILGCILAITLLGNCAAASTSISQAADSVSGSVSTAIGSISKSVSSVSKSSSDKAADSESYKKDVRTLIALYSQDEERTAHIEKDINRIARRNGILNWREHRSTYVAIGAGLREAGYARNHVVDIANQSCAGKPSIQEAILEGFEL